LKCKNCTEIDKIQGSQLGRMWRLQNDAVLLGLHGAYTKHSCFLWLWDSRADEQHYLRKDWPAREELSLESHNVKNTPLVQSDKILLPPLHIKLGLAKQFVKALTPESKAFQYICLMFPNLSKAKLKVGIFVGPQIRKMLSSKELEESMSDLEKNAWQDSRRLSWQP